MLSIATQSNYKELWTSQIAVGIGSVQIYFLKMPKQKHAQFDRIKKSILRAQHDVCFPFLFIPLEENLFGAGSAGSTPGEESGKAPKS